MRPWLANRLWQGLLQPAARRFSRALHDSETAQRRALLRVLAVAHGTQFARSHHLTNDMALETFQQRVPVRTYEELEPYIVRAAEGEQAVLTHEAPVCFEETSGSTRGAKLIPFTPSFLADMRAGIAPWIDGMMRTVPAMRDGRAYWSISPCVRPPRHTPGGTPIGVANDAAYFGGSAQWLLNSVLIGSPALARLLDHNDWRYATLAYLLAADDLAFISVWNPSFLTLLLEPLRAWLPALIKDAHDGTLTLPSGATHGAARDVARGMHANRTHARKLDAMASRAAHDDAALHRALWPRLALISCWADAAAAGAAQALAPLVPQARLHAKGLLAPEGVVSVAVGCDEGCALALTSHFFEFEPLDGGPLRTAWQLETGRAYQVVITTRAGLFR